MSIKNVFRYNQSCDIAIRLNRYFEWLDSLGKPCTEIEKSVKERYRYYLEDVRYSVDLPEFVFGDIKSPVLLVAYISISCPLCKKLYRDLADMLQQDRFNDVAFCIKPFAVTGLEEVLVLMQQKNMLDQFLRALVPVKERITMPIVNRIVDSLGVSLSDLKRSQDSLSTKNYLDSSRAEAIRNGVSVTPTFFINGKRYSGYKDARWVIDAVEYELEKSGGK
jgi:hypothetical protein